MGASMSTPLPSSTQTPVFLHLLGTVCSSLFSERERDSRVAGKHNRASYMNVSESNLGPLASSAGVVRGSNERVYTNCRTVIPYSRSCLLLSTLTLIP